MVKAAENQEERLFSTRQHSYFGVKHCENSEVQIAVFFEMKHAMRLETRTKTYFFVCLQPSVNKNS